MSRKKRGPLELRPVRIERGVIRHAAGSVDISTGDTRVLVTITAEKGVPPFLNGKNQGWITAEYGMLPASTHTRTQRKQSGRAQEIQRLVGRSLRAVADLKALDGYTLIADCDVLQADGGTRTASITAAWVALYDACQKLLHEGALARDPLLDQVAAVSVGLVNNELLLDLDYTEDSAAQVDMNVVMTGKGRFVEVQGTAEGQPFSRRILNQMLAAAREGIEELLQIQRKALQLGRK